jgi:hypothetical protein
MKGFASGAVASAIRTTYHPARFRCQDVGGMYRFVVEYDQ